jgi:hypothetical protein
MSLKLVFRDKNFRGLGQLFEIIVYHKEGVDAEVGKLPPAFKLKWMDCGIAKSSQISASIECEGIRGFSYDLHTQPIESDASFSQRVSAISSKVSATLQT